MRTLRLRLAGIAFLVVAALLIWLAVAVYQKDFSDDPRVVVETGSVGNEMHIGAEVKLRGVVVGEVRAIDASRQGARLTLAMKPGALESIPDDVRAQMLPTTLFGERYVALVADTSKPGTPLGAGAVIPQDRSANAIELQQVLDHTLPLLTAVQPQKLSATLSAVSRALDGRGDKLGETLTELDAHLKRFNPELPALNEDLKQLVTVSHVYADAAPGIVDALHDFTTTSGTLAEKESDLSAAYAGTTRAAEDVDGFLRANKDTIIRLSTTSRGTLQLLAEYSAEFPCTLRALTEFAPRMDRALGKGTGHPGVHVEVTTVPSRGAYRPGRDTPAYTASGGPHCYSAPYLGEASGTRPAATASASADKDLGPVNSPQENDLVNELLSAPAKDTKSTGSTKNPESAGAGTRAPDAESPAEELPDWSSLLAGPVFRGTEVRVK
ncbi:MCE family protein [Streptomyces sp. NPDC006684]|uniref:MCE family protein n=1 Tax=Streptomyces sp. NPDC006684 TaxID=3154477 RepID=UPI0034570B9F